MELFIILNIEEAGHGAAGLEQWESSLRTEGSMQFYKPAWGVTCSSGFHQAPLWVPEQNFLVCVIGRPLLPCFDSSYKAQKESCACGSFPAKPIVVLGSKQQQTNPAPHSQLGRHRLKANTDDERAWSPSILDIFFSIAGRAACRSVF